MLEEYLAELLGIQEARELMKALDSNVPVLVSGADDSGKTTLVKILKLYGYRAAEDCEVYRLHLNKSIKNLDSHRDSFIFSEQGANKCEKENNDFLQ